MDVDDVRKHVLRGELECVAGLLALRVDPEAFHAWIAVEVGGDVARANPLYDEAWLLLLTCTEDLDQMEERKPRFIVKLPARTLP